MGSRLLLRCQVFGSTLRRQVRLIMHVKNLEALIGLIFLFESSTSLDCRFRLASWEKETLSLLVPDETHLCLDRMIPDGYHVCPRRPRGLRLERDMWRGTPHKDQILGL